MTETLPLPGSGYDQEDESQFRRSLEQSFGGIRASLADVDSGGLVFLSAQTVSSPVTSVDFTTGIDTTYDEYILVLSNVIPDTDTANLILRTSTDAGASWDAGASDYHWQVFEARGGLEVAAEDLADTSIRLVSSVGSDANENGASMWMHLVRPSDVSFFDLYANGIFVNSTGSLVLALAGGRRLTAADVDGIRFLFSSGNVESGEFRLYGVVKS